LEDGEHITPAHLPGDLLGSNIVAADGAISGITLPPAGIPLETVELELARQAFERTGGNLTQAAKLLDISRDQLRYKLKKGQS
jgi:DNA-binding NtrC family response regulator